jgi:methionyl-tRNA formyltransferase
VIPPPVKNLAETHDIPVFQPGRVRTDQFIAELKALFPDLIVVVAFGQILPRAILDIPRFGCINVHASLLPKYRGAAPINWALINGETETGVTVMLLDEGMDTGGILLQEPVAITLEDTAATLHDRLALTGAHLLGEALNKFTAGVWQPNPQDHTKATYAPLLNKADGCIQWNKSAQEISNQMRGMNPWPGCFTFYWGKLLKVFSAEVIKGKTAGKPGQILTISRTGIEVATGRDSLLLKELQMEGKKRMAVEEFIRGHALKEGEEFTSKR